VPVPVPTLIVKNNVPSIIHSTKNQKVNGAGNRKASAGTKKAIRSSTGHKKKGQLFFHPINCLIHPAENRHCRFFTNFHTFYHILFLKKKLSTLFSEKGPTKGPIKGPTKGPVNIYLLSLVTHFIYYTYTIHLKKLV